MPKFFITAIGTDVGKTYCLSKLLKEIYIKHKSIAVAKPIITGFNKESIELSDSYKLLSSITNQPISYEDIYEISPFLFKDPLSPDHAAIERNNFIDYSKLLDFCNNFKNQNKDFIFFEGVGGINVPINNNYQILDLIYDLKIKVIIICANYLGCINHSLLTIDKLKDLNPLIFFNDYPNKDNFDNNLKSIENFSKANIFTDLKLLAEEIMSMN